MKVMNMVASDTPLTQRAHDELLKAILQGHLTADERLVITDLSKWLQMSRTPVRDAIKRLAVARVVAPIDGIGYRVVEPALRDIRDLVELLLLLEPRVAADAARLDPPMRGRLADHLDDSPRDDGGHEFHVRLGQAAANDYVMETIKALNERLTTARSHISRPCLDSDHHSIIANAIRRGRPDKAIDLTVRHLLSLCDEIYGGTS